MGQIAIQIGGGYPDASENEAFLYRVAAVLKTTLASRYAGHRISLDVDVSGHEGGPVVRSVNVTPPNKSFRDEIWEYLVDGGLDEAWDSALESE